MVDVKTFSRLYIDGEWVTPAASVLIDVVNASSEEVCAQVPAGTAEDVNRAVAAATGAFDRWSAVSPGDRAKYLRAIADGLDSRAAELARVIAEEVGSPLAFAERVQVGLAVGDIRSTADLIESYGFEEAHGNSLVVKEPVGVVGAITPWNYPLHQITAKLAPSLAAGCTIVLKPSEVAPSNAFVLAEIIAAAGVPAGVFNLVTGNGPVAGEALASHAGVDMVSFTGSTAAGRRVAELGARTVKRVALELGGKSPNILLDDADFEAAVPHGILHCYLNAGQTCTALTRMLVPRSRLDQVETLAARISEKYTVGDPLLDGTQIGPLASAAQRDRVQMYIAKGSEEGARLVSGGAGAPEGLDRGYFVRPTVFSDVEPRMAIARDEIFGPVLAIMPYDDEADAIRIANDSTFGLAGRVWSMDPERAKRAALRLRTGQVGINAGPFNPTAPFGGYKQSGNGREYGKWGLEEYFETKALQL